MISEEMSDCRSDRLIDDKNTARIQKRQLSAKSVVLRRKTAFLSAMSDIVLAKIYMLGAFCNN